MKERRRLGLTPDADPELLLRARVHLDDDAHVLVRLLEPQVDNLPQVQLHPAAAVLPQLHLTRENNFMILSYFIELSHFPYPCRLLLREEGVVVLVDAHVVHVDVGVGVLGRWSLQEQRSILIYLFLSFQKLLEGKSFPWVCGARGLPW